MKKRINSSAEASTPAEPNGQPAEAAAGTSANVNANHEPEGERDDNREIVQPLPEALVATKSSKGPEAKSEDSAEDSDPFDFGGLPNRNLKKNLGCG